MNPYPEGTLPHHAFEYRQAMKRLGEALAKSFGINWLVRWILRQAND